MKLQDCKKNGFGKLKKIKHGGTIKLNKREKYYARHGFTKKQKLKLDF